MYTGQTVFSQLMEFLPMYEFRKCVDRYSGNYDMFSDSFLVVALFFATGYGFLLRRYHDRRIAIRWGFVIFLIINFGIVLAHNMNLPWVSPLEQLQHPVD